jgi:glycosyltransferase 2 family protein
MMERMPLGVSISLDRKAKISLLVAVVLAAVLLYFSLKGIDMAELGQTLKRARLQPLGLAVLVSAVSLLLRAYRWRALLNGTTKLPFDIVFWATSIGYLGNNLLPARMGELMRVEALKRKADVTRSYVLATALIERVMDAGVLVLFTGVALLTMPSLPEGLHKASKTFSLLSGIGILTLFLLPHAEGLIHKLLDRVPHLKDIASRFLEGLRCLHDWSRATQFLLLTFLIWPIDSYAGVLAAESIGAALDFPTSMVALAALGLSSAVPSTPGGLGVFQFVAVTVLKPFGIPSAAALAWVLLYQACGYIVQCCFGLIGLLVLSRPAAIAKSA